MLIAAPRTVPGLHTRNRQREGVSVAYGLIVGELVGLIFVMFNALHLRGMMGGKGAFAGCAFRCPLSFAMIAKWRLRSRKCLAAIPTCKKKDITEALQYAAWLTDEAISARHSDPVISRKQGVSIRVVDWLREHGHDAVHVRELAMSQALDGISLPARETENRIVLTFDLDFR